MSKRPEPPKLWRSVFYPPPDYPYFERAPAFTSAPLTGRLNVLKAAWMADAAMLAYDRSGPDPIPVMRFAKNSRDSRFYSFRFDRRWSGGPKGTQAYFAYTPEFAVLAFRGTEKNDWKDLAADLATWPVEPDRSPAGLGVANGPCSTSPLRPASSIGPSPPFIAGSRPH